jgi:predicted acetyltransferase
VILREVRPEDEDEVRAGHRAMAETDGFTFGLGLEPGMAWADYLAALADHGAGRNLPDGWVPGTFLVAEVDGRIVGRSSIRHRLTPALEREGGHIGYGVLPEHRRRGHATEILRQSLVIAAGLGITSALVTCDDDNTGSRTVIEACGGRLESVVPPVIPGAPPVRRYRIGPSPVPLSPTLS